MQTRILDKGVPGEGGPPVCYGMRKICIIAQFSLEILLIQYWELLLACPVLPDHIHRN